MPEEGKKPNKKKMNVYSKKGPPRNGIDLFIEAIRFARGIPCLPQMEIRVFPGLGPNGTLSCVCAIICIIAD
jgi:hypothetical protein